MANFNSLKATINAQIKANGVQAITGPILNAVLTAMINTIGNGYTLQGSVAQTTDNPGAPDNPVAYLAAGPGTYTNFGGTVIPDDGHAYLLTWDTSWHAVQLPLPTYDLANGKQDALTFDDNPTPGSDNPVKSNGIAEALDDKQDKDTGDTAGHVAVMDGNGNSVDGGKALADLATKEDVEAVEQEVAQIAGEAGLAEAVIDTDGAGTEQEFTFRKSGGDGGAYYRKIKGKTLGWNQLVNTWDTTGSGELYGVTYTGTDEGIVVNGTATAQDIGHQSSVYVAKNLQLPFGHKILVFLNKKQYQFRLSDEMTDSLFGDNGVGIFTNNLTGLAHIQISLNVGATANNELVKCNVIDLTILYGNEIAGMTDAQILAKYEAKYGTNLYPYTPGTLISNDAEAVETTGANQWDDNAATRGKFVYMGTLNDNASYCVSDYIPIVPNTPYYLKNVVGSGVQNTLCYYDAQKTALGMLSIAGGGDASGEITLPAECAYIRVNAFQENLGDICINLSNPAINGQYFPYWKRTLQLGITTRKDTDGNVPFADGMKGAGTAADWADKVGGEIVMDKVDLGTLNWQLYAEGKYYAVISTLGVKIPAQDSGIINILSEKYAVSAPINGGFPTTPETLALNPNNQIYATTAQPPTGILVFERATPVPFTWAEPLNLGVKVDENGTERAVAPEGATAPSAPFVADTTYTMSIARMVAKLQSI